MHIVIDIPEEYLNSNIIDVTLFTGVNNTITDVNVEDKYAEFQVIPKGHGDLIDLDALKGELWWVTDCPRVKLNEQALDIWKAIEAAKTVIPAER